MPTTTPVRSGGDNWWDRVGAVPYRELVNAPGIARAHDFQRLLSYGLALVVGFVIDLPAWRVVIVAALSAVHLSAAARRLITNRRTAPFRIALGDLAFASLIVAVATGTPLLTVGVVGVVALTVAASFAAPGWWLAAATVGTAAVTLTVAAGTGAGPSGVSDSLVALVLIVLLLSIAVLILVFFTFQAMELRRTLSSREVQLSSVLSVTPVVVATVDPSGMVTAIAGDVRGRLGLPGDRVDDGSDIGGIIRAAADGDRMIRELPIADRTFSVTADPGPDGSVLLTAYDMTEQVEARRHLEGMMRSKDQFIAAISHELRTPLAAVLGFAEEVRDEIEGDDPLRPMVEVIADQSAEMAAIIEDLLVVARSSFESVTMAPRPIQLAEEAAAVTEAMGSRLSKRAEPHLEPVTAFADPIRVRQIVRNLLTNADRYGGEEIQICTRTEDGRAVLEIRDNGMALAPVLRERIFEPYESSGPVGGQPAAIGLGLAVSRTLAELMSGTLEYTHRDGWSVFELRLPGVPARVPA